MMRCVFAFLALAQTRLAQHDLERSRLLGDDAELAYRRAQDRMELAHALATRAGMSRR